MFIDPAGTVTDGSSTSAALKRMKNTALEEDDGEEGVKVSITVGVSVSSIYFYVIFFFSVFYTQERRAKSYPLIHDLYRMMTS